MICKAKNEFKNVWMEKSATSTTNKKNDCGRKVKCGTRGFTEESIRGVESGPKTNAKII